MTLSIMLACAGGFSTSMLVERMKDAAKERGMEVNIDATAEGKVDKLIDPEYRHPPAGSASRLHGGEL